ncbi:hypothetical protein RUM43_007113, partial [Polyplax serrata]
EEKEREREISNIENNWTKEKRKLKEIRFITTMEAPNNIQSSFRVNLMNFCNLLGEMIAQEKNYGK